MKSESLKMSKNKLLQLITSDGLYLHGYYAPSENKKTAMLYVHGLGGNFYQDNYVYPLLNEFEKKDIGFLGVNNRGNGKETDFNTTDGKIKRIGAKYELLEEAHMDITPCIKFLIDEGYGEIVLMGHSAGTVKAVRYLFEGDLKAKINKLVLLSPIDPLSFRASRGRKNIEEFLFKARAKVDSGKGDELVTTDFDHDILSYKTFASWYKRDDLGRMFEFCSPEYKFPILKKISVPTKIITGTEDEYLHPSNPKHPEEAMEILLKNIPNSTGKIIDGALHSFKPHENVMVEELSSFILDNK